MIILLPACYSIPKTRVSERPEDISFDVIPTWISSILDVEPAPCKKPHSPEEVANYINGYELSHILKNSLIELYCAYKNEVVAIKDSVKAIVIYKLKEGYELCAQGFHERVDFCLMNFAPLVIIEDYLCAERRSIVDKTAQDNVHTHRDYFSIAKSEFGLDIFSPDAPSFGYEEERIIKENLNNAFRKYYTPWKIAQSLLTGIRSRLHEVGYTGIDMSEDGYFLGDYHRFQDILYKFFGEPNKNELNQDFFIIDIYTMVIRDINWIMIRRLILQRLFRDALPIDADNNDEYPLFFSVSPELKEHAFFSSLIDPNKEISFDDLSKDWFRNETEILDFFSFFDIHEIEKQYVIAKTFFGIDKLGLWSYVVKSISALIIPTLNDMSESEKVQSLLDDRNQCMLAGIFINDRRLESLVLEIIETLPEESRLRIIQSQRNKNSWRALYDALQNIETPIEPILESIASLDSQSKYEILQVQDEMGVSALMIAVIKRHDAVAILMDLIKTLPVDLQCALVQAEEIRYGFNSYQLAMEVENSAALTPLLELIQTFSKESQYLCLQVESDEECAQLLLKMMEDKSTGVVPLIKIINTFSLDSQYAIMQVRDDDRDYDDTPIMYAAMNLFIAFEPLLDIIGKFDEAKICAIIAPSSDMVEGLIIDDGIFLPAIRAGRDDIFDSLLALIKDKCSQESQYKILNAKDSEAYNSIMNAIRYERNAMLDKLLELIDTFDQELKLEFFNAQDNLLELAIIYQPDVTVKLKKYIQQLSEEQVYKLLNCSEHNLLMKAALTQSIGIDVLYDLFLTLSDELQLQMLSSKNVYECIENAIIKTPEEFKHILQFIKKLPDLFCWQIVKPTAEFNLLQVALRGAIEVYMNAYEEVERANQALNDARCQISQSVHLNHRSDQHVLAIKRSHLASKATSLKYIADQASARNDLVSDVVSFINLFDDDRVKEYLVRDGHCVIFDYLMGLNSLTTADFYISLISSKLKISIYPPVDSKRRADDLVEIERDHKRPRIEEINSGANIIDENSDEEGDVSQAYPSSPMQN